MAEPGNARHFTSLNPPSEEQGRMLASGLMLAGQPLQPPRFHPVDWRVGDLFSPAQDPDRIAEPWEAPEFIAMDPATRHSQLKVEEIHLPHKPDARSFARVVRNVMTDQECAALIEGINKKGFTPALTNMGDGSCLQQLCPDYRDGFRVMVESSAFTSWLLEVLRPALPECVTVGHETRVLESLNERLRFLCYTPGQKFEEHRDARFKHPITGATSAVTLQIYLHDVAPQSGGATTFLFEGKGPDVPCQPGAGTVLLFSQDLLHEGSLLKSGLKYTCRTEAMYLSHEVRQLSSEYQDSSSESLDLLSEFQDCSSESLDFSDESCDSSGEFQDLSSESLGLSSECETVRSRPSSAKRQRTHC